MIRSGFTPQQIVVLKPLLLGLAGFTVSLGLTGYALHLGLIALSPLQLLAFLLVYLVIQVQFPILFLSKRRLPINRPFLIFVSIWATLTVQMPLLYFMDSSIRGVMLFIFLSPMLFAIFRLGFRWSLHLAIYPIIYYAVVILFLARNQPESFDLKVELFRFIAFTLSCIWLALFSGVINRLRRDMLTQKLALARTNEELLQTQGLLVDAARRAGKAEIAAELLHNVGHALNGLSVSTGMIGDRIQGIKLGYLRTIARLLKDHSDHLDEFFASDPRAAKIPAILERFVTLLGNAQEQTIKEVINTELRLDQVREILRSQHDHIFIDRAAVEKVNPNQMIRETLIARQSLTDVMGITLEFDLKPLPPIWLPKPKLNHVLINLVQNACEAMRDLPKDEPRVLLLRSRVGGRRRIDIEIIDTGPGIPEHLLDQIFTHGFTTKEEGLGFGLFYCAAAMNEMRGRISAANRENRRGTIIRLELPINECPPQRQKNLADSNTN